MNQIIGKHGEEIACEYLKAKGYKILARNVRTTSEEIDIVASMNNFLVIVEVKTRSSKRYGVPEDAVNYFKQKKLVDAADKYIAKHDISMETRFDIISIIINNANHSVNHIINAFSPFD